MNKILDHDRHPHTLPSRASYGWLLLGFVRKWPRYIGSLLKIYWNGEYQKVKPFTHTCDVKVKSLRCELGGRLGLNTNVIPNDSNACGPISNAQYGGKCVKVICQPYHRLKKIRIFFNINTMNSTMTQTRFDWSLAQLQIFYATLILLIIM